MSQPENTPQAIEYNPEHATQLAVDDKVALDHLGPVVINEVSSS